MECTDQRKPWDANPQSRSPGSQLPRAEHLDMAMSTQGDIHVNEGTRIKVTVPHSFLKFHLLQIPTIQ